MDSILEINKPALRYCKDANKQINSICEPLFNLGLNYFSYFKLLNDGRFLIFFTDVALTEEWLTKPGGFGNITRTMFEKKEPKSYFLAAFDEESLNKDRTVALLKQHGVANSFGIHKRDNFGCLTAFGFYSRNSDPLSTRFYVENIPLLEHFSQYFELKAKNLINPTNNRVFANFRQKLDISNQLEETNTFKNKINQFLLETKLPHTILKCKAGDVKLTTREEQCLLQLSQGRTFKEIAYALGLSPRTVEFYYNRLKERSGYQSREELIILFNKSFIPITNRIHPND
jgi:DNA-binding CsgD family transcriptional regulator